MANDFRGFQTYPPLTVDQLIAAIGTERGTPTSGVETQGSQDNRLFPVGPLGPPREETFTQPGSGLGEARQRQIETVSNAFGRLAQVDDDALLDQINRAFDTEYGSVDEAIRDRGYVGLAQTFPNLFAQHLGRGFGIMGDIMFGTSEPHDTGPPFVGGPGPQQPAGPPTLDQTVAGLGVGIQPESNQPFSIPAPLPPTGQEVFGDAPEMPTLSRDAVDTFMRDLGESMPEEFDRRQVDLNRVLAGMGEGMLQLGRAPTLGQALLGAGTGGTSVMAQHEAEQDQLERQAEEARRQHQIMMAESAFAGEQIMTEQEQASWQADMNQLREIAEQDAVRLNEILRRTDVEVGNDGELIIRRPGTDEQGRNTIEVDVIRPNEAQGMMDHFAGNLVGEDFEPVIGGKDMSALWQSLGGESKGDALAAMMFAWGMPGDNIPTPEGRHMVEMYRERAREYVNEVADYGLRGTDAEDAQEHVFFTMMMEDQARYPGLRYQIWAGSGNPILQEIGMNALENLNFNFETGKFPSEDEAMLPTEEEVNRERNIQLPEQQQRRGAEPGRN